MCGINGCIATSPVTEKLIKMNQRIYHRGPDEDGFFNTQNEKFSIGMAMRRLSIIDLATGTQPLYSNNKEKVIVFNGEIYNYKSLKQDLITKGYSFSTASDTEVVVNLYDCYGVEAFAKLDGMFAFSIYDTVADKLIIARDFFGEKPLYYYHDDQTFIWASELKSIITILPSKPKIDVDALNMYLQLTYIPAPYSIYEGIRKLEANHYLTLDCNSLDFTINEIAHDFKKYEDRSFPAAVQYTHDLVQASVASRSISDVPIGTFLSGGIDSSIVSLCLAQQSDQKINTFSIGFEKKSFDETDKSRLVAQLINSQHHEFVIGSQDLTDHLDEIVLNFDEPFADSSALATYLVAHKTKENVSVALPGDGGDEVFGGYNKYYMGNLNTHYTNLIPKRLHQSFLKVSSPLLKTSDDNRGIRFKLNRLMRSINYEGDFYYNIISLGYTEQELHQLLHPAVLRNKALDYYKHKFGTPPTTLTDFRNIDRLLSLEGDMLVKVDRTSMLASLECRAPFLNKELWNFTEQLPQHFLIHKTDKKHILKEAFKAYFPKDFLNKSKKGFGVPVGDWLRHELQSELLSYLDQDFIQRQALFQYDVIFPLVMNHIQGKIDNTFRVWTFYCFQKWYTTIYAA